MKRKEREAIMYKPKNGFFYLNESLYKPKGIKTVTLKKDVERGVKTLSEWSYADDWGATRTSLRFFNALKKYIDVTKVFKAEMLYSIKTHYTLRLYTINGHTLIFKGVSSGYIGDGTRGCYDILKACGFSEPQCQKAFSLESFKVYKKIR
jgi:hypothetical protein